MMGVWANFESLKGEFQVAYKIINSEVVVSNKDLSQLLHDLSIPLSCLNISLYSMNCLETQDFAQLSRQIELANVANKKLNELVQSVKIKQRTDLKPIEEVISPLEEVEDILKLLEAKINKKQLKIIFSNLKINYG